MATAAAPESSLLSLLYRSYPTAISPDATEPDPTHPEQVRAFRAVPERDGRILRVIYVPTEDGARVVTAFLDRNRRRSP